MSQQQFYETVMLEAEFMDSWTKEFITQGADDLYCWNCLEIREDKVSCCNAKHFLKLKDLPETVQRNIANSEYEKAYGK